MTQKITAQQALTAIEIAKFNAESGAEVRRAGKDYTVFRHEVMSQLESLIPDGICTPERLKARLEGVIGLNGAEAASAAYRQAQSDICFGATTLLMLRIAQGRAEQSRDCAVGCHTYRLVADGPGGAVGWQGRITEGADPRDVAAKERDDAKFKAITSAIGEIL